MWVAFYLRLLSLPSSWCTGKKINQPLFYFALIFLFLGTRYLLWAISDLIFFMVYFDNWIIYDFLLIPVLAAAWISIIVFVDKTSIKIWKSTSLLSASPYSCYVYHYPANCSSIGSVWTAHWDLLPRCTCSSHHSFAVDSRRFTLEKNWQGDDELQPLPTRKH